MMRGSQPMAALPWTVPAGREADDLKPACGFLLYYTTFAGYHGTNVASPT
jgi:hypothetical protein